MAAGILAVSGFIGLLIASVGIYGVISYSVAQRVREIGIRAALGARRGDIMRLVIREGIGVACLGSVLGMALAYAVIRIVSRLFASVPALDSLTSISASLFLAAVILFACLIPARRATRVDPAEILKGP